MSAAAAIAAAVAVQSTQRANEACQKLVDAYDASIATVGQAQAYAACITRLYPTQVSADMWALKVWVAIMLLSVLLGFIRPMWILGSRWENMAFSAFIYPCSIACIGVFGIAVYMGAKFVIG